jgi:hypothetical protein
MDAEQFLTQWIQAAERKTELLSAWANQQLQDSSSHPANAPLPSQRLRTTELIASLDQLCETVKSVDESRLPETISVPANRDVGLTVVDVCQTLILGLSGVDAISAEEFRKHVERAFASIDTSDLASKPQETRHPTRS